MSEPLINGPVRNANGSYTDERADDTHCPWCGSKGSIATPDYGYGYGTQYQCHCNGRRNTWAAESAIAQAESAASLGASRANAAAYATQQARDRADTPEASRPRARTQAGDRR